MSPNSFVTRAVRTRGHGVNRPGTENSSGMRMPMSDDKIQRGVEHAVRDVDQPASSRAEHRDPTADVDPEALVRAWDWPIRVVHWAMVLLLIALVVTAEIGGLAMDWHMRAGETMLGLVLFRIFWGFGGPANARFANFVRGPRAVASYARSLRHPPHQSYPGHNPLGGWMVISLFLALLVQTGTGLFSNDDVASEGPLARFIDEDLSSLLSSVHRSNAWIVFALATIHVSAVLFYLFKMKENLITPMIVRDKRPPGPAAAKGQRASSIRALLLAAFAALIVWRIVTRV